MIMMMMIYHYVGDNDNHGHGYQTFILYILQRFETCDLH